MTTNPDPIETAEAAILRLLRDTDSPVPLADLDDIADRRIVSAALTRLGRAGVIDISAGHITLSRARVHREPVPAPPPEPKPVKPSPLRRAGPTTRDVLGFVISALAEAPMTTEELRDVLPTAVTERLDSVLTYGMAIGALGQRRVSGEPRWFVAAPRGLKVRKNRGA